MTMLNRLLATSVLAGAALIGSGQAQADPVRHVLLISIDGLHAVDLENLIAAHPDAPLAALAVKGTRYVNAATPIPSDSFPGLLAQITGGTPRSTGVYYDDSYDRTLSPPGSDCSTVGTETAFTEDLDYDDTALDGGAGKHGGVAIDPARLPRDPKNGCQPVYPHSFLRVNTVFDVIRSHGGHTAWADKHPAYDLVNGPSGKGVEDLYTPEVQSADNTVPATEANDDLKVAAVISEINGKTSDGARTADVPTILGMNFQAVSVGQKLAGVGYLDALATPSAGLEDAILHTSGSIGSIVQALATQKLLDSTLIIISAKHGQSPIQPGRTVGIDDAAYGKIIGDNLAFEIADDATYIWLKDQGKAAEAVAALTAHQDELGIGEIFTGPALAARLTDPATDSRAPDIAIQSRIGVVYKGAKSTKIAEHGGTNPDDTNVALLVSGPGIGARVVTQPAQTAEIAPTILTALGLDPAELAAVKQEGTSVLPGLGK
jgi:predicted AlkP superfamily pyrophosphatase or phosphodiesterase